VEAHALVLQNGHLAQAHTRWSTSAAEHVTASLYGPRLHFVHLKFQ